jgi:hypothetical protein
MRIIADLIKGIFSGIFGLLFGIFSLIVLGVDYYVFYKAYGTVGLFAGIVFTPITIVAAPFYALFQNHFWMPMMLTVIQLFLASFSGRSRFFR